MSETATQLEAGGLLPAKTKADAGATEQMVARTYRHPALGDRAVIRLASDRLGQAEDLAMEFLGFEMPSVSPPVAIQQRRSLGFAEWALINDPGNARYALDLVKLMKKAARQAKSKPGHAWDAYTAMAKDLGRSARQFLPPFWEEVGRAFKDLGNPTYAGRALNKSLEAERVHALESDRARRRDVVLEFVLSGCLAGSALSEYGNDLANQYPPAEAYAVFRDLCVRRTRGGMAPWASMPKEFAKLAKAAGLNADKELEVWLEEVIEAPAMGRAPAQFWKACSGLCKNIVGRNPVFPVALLRHTRPEDRHYGESKMGPWLELLEEWGVLDYLWEDEHRGAPPLGEPIAVWMGRIVRDEVPAPKRTFDMLEKFAPRLRKENAPLPLSVANRWGHATVVDIDVLESCLALGIKVDDPPANAPIGFTGWLAAEPDHPRRNQDPVESAKDERFRVALAAAVQQALQCKGGTANQGYRRAGFEQRAFPLAAADRPSIVALWRENAAAAIASLEGTGLASFEAALTQLESTLWPDTLRLFPDLAEQLDRTDPTAMLRRTLQTGSIDEYGWPAFEELVDREKIALKQDDYGDSNLHLCFPNIVVTDKVHAYVVAGDGTSRKRELHLPKGSECISIVVVGDDLVVLYRDKSYRTHFHWVSDPSQTFEASSYGHGNNFVTTTLADGSVFFGTQSVRPGDKQFPSCHDYFHDGDRFWRAKYENDPTTNVYRPRFFEIDPQTGKEGRESVPPWFENAEGGMIVGGQSDLLPAPAGTENSPLGVKNGLVGWKAVVRRDGTHFGEGIDGRRWEKPLGLGETPVGLLRQPGTDAFLPLSAAQGYRAGYSLWDPTGSTVVASLQANATDYAGGQVALLPLQFWHLLKLRDEASSKTLRSVSVEQCASLYQAAAADREQHRASRAQANPLETLVPAVKALLPTAPARMAEGIARLIERAEGKGAALTSMRDKMRADSAKGIGGDARLAYLKSDVGAAHWGLEGYHIYDDKSASVSAHLVAAAEFLKGDSKGGDLPRTSFLWYAMLDELPLRCWQTYWRATAAKLAKKDDIETPWLEFLRHWHEFGLDQLPGQFDVMEGITAGTKKNTWGGYDIDGSPGKSFAFTSGEDRFIVVEEEGYEGLPYNFLRYSTAKSPGSPPGYDVKNVRRIKSKRDPGKIADFIAAAQASTEMPMPSADELAAVAESLGVSAAEIGLIWIGGLNLDSYQNNFLPAEVRTALGLKTTEASAGRQSLRNLDAAALADLYAAVVAEGCAAPFAADRGPVLRALEKTWQRKMPKRFRLDAALQKRLSALGASSRWHRINHQELLAVAADPAEHPLLQPREVEIKINKERHYASLALVPKKKGDQAVSADLIRSIAQLIALIHSDTPAGDPAREGMPGLAKQMFKLLDHPSTMLELRSIHLYPDERKKTPTPSEWIAKYIGKPKKDAKDSLVRVDDGFFAAAGVDAAHQAFVAFHPAKLKSKSDLARLLAVLAPDYDEFDESDQSPTPLVQMLVAIKSPGFRKLVAAILAKGLPAGSWPQNPMVTVPKVVEAIRKKLKVSEEAAVLYAQLLALPDPTGANVCAWNGWSTPQLKKAAAELVASKKVLEATRARAGRSYFLPGEWTELKSPWLPIETWKFAHLVDLDLDPRERCPLGGPMVLRPFEDLFAAAWKRVTDGDEPRYEEVKRKKKTK